MAMFQKQDDHVLDHFIECLAQRIISHLAKENPWPNEYLTIEETAERTRLPVSYLQKQIDTGALPAANLGCSRIAKYRISEDDLERFMEDKKALDYVSRVRFWEDAAKKYDLN